MTALPRHPLHACALVLVLLLPLLGHAADGAIGKDAKSTAVATDLQQISYLTEDYPPFNYVETGQTKGISVDLLKLVWKHLGVPEQPIEVTSWPRAIRATLSTPNTVLFATARTVEREDRFLWAGPIGTDRDILVSREDREIHLASARDAVAYRVAVLREDIGHREMLEAGLDDAKLEKVGNFRQLVKLLVKDRVDLICVSETLLASIKEIDDAPAIKPVFVVSETPLYYAFNKQTSPALVAKFQAALKAVEPERKLLLKRAGLSN